MNNYMAWFYAINHSFQTGIIPWAAKRFSTQKTTCFAVIFFSSMRKGSTVLAPEPYEDNEKPFGPVQMEKNVDHLCVQWT